MKRTPHKKRPKQGIMDNAAIHERLAPVKNPLVKSFATRVLKWRQTEGKTLKEVASDLDMSMAIVCEWEHGHRFPSIDALLALSKYTGIPASEFLREPKEGGGKRRPR